MAAPTWSMRSMRPAIRNVRPSPRLDLHRLRTRQRLLVVHPADARTTPRDRRRGRRVFDFRLEEQLDVGQKVLRLALEDLRRRAPASPRCSCAKPRPARASAARRHPSCVGPALRRRGIARSSAAYRSCSSEPRVSGSSQTSLSRSRSSTGRRPGRASGRSGTDTRRPSPARSPRERCRARTDRAPRPPRARSRRTR